MRSIVNMMNVKQNKYKHLTKILSVFTFWIARFKFRFVYIKKVKNILFWLTETELKLLFDIYYTVRYYFILTVLCAESWVSYFTPFFGLPLHSLGRIGSEDRKKNCPI